MAEQAYQEALTILREHQDGLTQLANKLVEKEVIFGEDLELIFGKRPWDNNNEENTNEQKLEEHHEGQEGA